MNEIKEKHIYSKDPGFLQLDLWNVNLSSVLLYGSLRKRFDNLKSIIVKFPLDIISKKNN